MQRRQTAYIFVLILTLAVTGHAQQTSWIRVISPAGDGIPGARVEAAATGPSGKRYVVITDGAGWAKLNLSLSGTGDESGAATGPGNFLLLSNYPNPFSSTTTIRLRSAKSQNVDFRIVDILGREVVQKRLPVAAGGEQVFLWDGNNTAGQRVPPGMYFAIAQVGPRRTVQKMLLLHRGSVHSSHRSPRAHTANSGSAAKFAASEFRFTITDTSQFLRFVPLDTTGVALSDTLLFQVRLFQTPFEVPALSARASFPIGAAVDVDKVRNMQKYRDILQYHFSSITPEVAMKMAPLHPQENVFDWEAADFLVQFARSLGKKVHGHTLVWHQNVPQWMLNFQGTPAAWEAMLRRHIQTVVAHYKGRVESWDVVNEAFELFGTMSNTLWRENLGPDYVAKCFFWAHEADPQAKLFYNDFLLPQFASKLKAVLAMIDDFQRRDPAVPIHGVGLQMHVTETLPTFESIVAALDSLKKRNMLVRFSEVDVSLNFNGNRTELTEELKQIQKERIRQIVKAYLTLPPELRAGITFWGVGDADSWLREAFDRPDWPLLFDDQYEPKPAFFGMLEALE